MALRSGLAILLNSIRILRHNSWDICQLRHDIQHNDIQHNDTQHNGTQHNVIQFLPRVSLSCVVYA
jgi:hypothetical protein